MVRAAPRGQPLRTSALPACPVGEGCMPSAPLTCATTAVPRRLVGDTFLSLSLLLNESPSRSVSSSIASTRAPFLPLASGCLAAPALPLRTHHTRPLCAGTIDLSFDALCWPFGARRDLELLMRCV